MRERTGFFGAALSLVLTLFGCSSSTGQGSLEPYAAWKVTLERTPVGDRIVEGEGRIYFEAVTPSDGTTHRQLWEVMAPSGQVGAKYDLAGSLGESGLRVPPIVSSGTVYVAEGQKLSAFADGKQKWMAPDVQDSEPLIVTSEAVYKANFDGSLTPLDPATGKLHSGSLAKSLGIQKGFQERTFGAGRFLLLEKDKPSRSLLAADPTSDRAAWTLPAATLPHSGGDRGNPSRNLRIDGDRVVFGTIPPGKGPHIAAADIRTGKFLWSQPVEQVGGLWGVGGGRVATLREGSVQIWDGMTGAQSKTIALNLPEKWQAGIAAITGDFLVFNAFQMTPGFGGIENRMLVAINVTTGKRLFSVRGGAFDLLFSVGASGTIYTNIGPTLYALKLK